MAPLSHVVSAALLVGGIIASPTGNDCEQVTSYVLTYKDIGSSAFPILNPVFPPTPYKQLKYSGLGVKSVGGALSPNLRENDFLVYGTITTASTLESPLITKDYEGSKVKSFELETFDFQCVRTGLENEKRPCKLTIKGVDVNGNTITEDCPYDPMAIGGNLAKCTLVNEKNLKSVSFETTSTITGTTITYLTAMDNLKVNVRASTC
ncbi:hypothetical protein BDP55DRAFT_718992 [Colletotrichum godetiae]|uniref:Phosphatidylglycerol/phosphatidylinositol transfer protein n=1 Tax=Colletotrichum godetiae TaxID=1209918 RepID=A0AAJ0ADG5_9PEZI|nr:uncharacterized protein BDP55DRAFT_718992 [Colletotrichum godetiae]KAK1671285.1 hypothetical protein BDP55DRAFT_718992 [Colletotrichum godetiae]